MSDSSSSRFAIFILVFAVMVAWETLKPFRTDQSRLALRWRNNLFLAAINSVAVMLLGTVSAVSAALYTSSQSIGLLSWINLPAWVSILLAIVVLDFAIYAQHAAAHRFQWFWRLHQVHHADTGYDVTTAIRFHPLEIVLSVFIKIAVIVLIGAPVEAVIAFEIILNGMALFNHGNVRLHKSIEHWIRALIVTPDMHRIHHSQDPSEHHQNFGFNLSIWDHLFKTYKASANKSEIEIGLDYIKEKTDNTNLVGLLLLPLKPKN